MALKPNRIRLPRQERPYAAWLSGLALAMLMTGIFGAMHPLLPFQDQAFAAASDAVEIQDFAPSTEPPASVPKEESPPPAEPPVELEIPPLPEVTPPLAPPEVPELVAEEKPPPVSPPKPKMPAPEKPRSQSIASARAAQPSSAASSAPVVFKGGGGGRFPEPAYPMAAKASHTEGTVKLTVTVEASGLPSSVEVSSSSGSRLLDASAADCVHRRWRWPSGPVRHYLVPVKFQLQ